MNYGEIKKYDIANGEGVRVSLFVSGCTHHCPGCFNQETWDFGFGKPYTEETEREILEALAPGYIAGLSLLGGEPLSRSTRRCWLGFCGNLKNDFRKKRYGVIQGICLTGSFWKKAGPGAGGRTRCFP